MAIIKVQGRNIQPPDDGYLQSWESWILDTTNGTITFNKNQWSMEKDLEGPTNTFNLNDITLFHCEIRERNWSFVEEKYKYEPQLEVYFFIHDELRAISHRKFHSPKLFDVERFEKAQSEFRGAGFRDDGVISIRRVNTSKSPIFKYPMISHFKAKKFVEILTPYVRTHYNNETDVEALIYPLHNWELLYLALHYNIPIQSQLGEGAYADQKKENTIGRGAYADQIKENNVLLSNGSINPEWIASLQLPTAVLELVIENQIKQGFDTSNFPKN